MNHNQPTPIGIEDPEYYTGLLDDIPRYESWRLPSKERFCLPGIQDIDSVCTHRLQSSILDAIANISLCRPGNFSATTAYLLNDRSILATQLYIVFNHEDDDAARNCPQHLRSIFDMLRQVPYSPPAMDGSPTVITGELEGHLIEVSKAIHEYSFDIFVHRVTKHKHKLSDIRKYVEKDEEHFSDYQREMLMHFFEDVDMVIKFAAVSQHNKQLNTASIRALMHIHWYWKNHDLLPKNELDDNEPTLPTLLDQVDMWLAKTHGLGFQLQRWAIKIMSFVISANRLFMLSQSRHRRLLLEGKFTVQVLRSPTTTPYRCNLSLETIQQALSAALAGTSYLSADWVTQRKTFIEQLLKGQEGSDVCKKPTVHAELAMIMAIVKGEVRHEASYIGVSNPSCVMCSNYIHIFNKVMKQTIATRGSHEKAYPGWSWPSLPSHDRKLRPAFLNRIRKQLRRDFEHANAKRLSVGCPTLAGVTRDEISELIRTCNLSV